MVAPDAIPTDERRALLQVARHAIARAVGVEPLPVVPSDPPDRPSHGAFVTLHRSGHLRGCIGTFAQGPSLVQTVREMAVAAATRDPRFTPLRDSEFSEIDIEISVLTPLRRIDDPASIEVGRHGICLAKGFHRGVLLPQVAVENGWDRETFLDHTCLKAGLAPGSWRDPDCTIEVFEAIVFGERDPELRSDTP